MILDNIFSQAATPPGGAPRAGTGAIIPAGFGLLGAGVRRRSLAARTFGLSSVTLFAAALAISGRAHADPLLHPDVSISPLPVASGFVAATAAPGIFKTDMGSGPLAVASSTVGLNLFGGPFTSSAQAREFITPEPALDVAVGGNNVFLPTSSFPSASAMLEYHFAVIPPVGASTPTMVPVFVRYAIGADLSEGAVFQVEGLVQLVSLSMGSSICGAPTSCLSSGLPSDSLRFGKVIAFQPGVVQDVDLTAAITFESSTTVSGVRGSFDGTVIIDPTFTIDPAFLQQHPGYFLQFSPGIGDSATGVPEPATWTMMLVGFGGLGAAISVARHSRGFRCST